MLGRVWDLYVTGRCTRRAAACASCAAAAPLGHKPPAKRPSWGIRNLQVSRVARDAVLTTRCRGRTWMFQLSQDAPLRCSAIASRVTSETMVPGRSGSGISQAARLIAFQDSSAGRCATLALRLPASERRWRPGTTSITIRPFSTRCTVSSPAEISRCSRMAFAIVIRPYAPTRLLIGRLCLTDTHRSGARRHGSVTPEDGPSRCDTAAQGGGPPRHVQPSIW